MSHVSSARWGQKVPTSLFCDNQKKQEPRPISLWWALSINLALSPFQPNFALGADASSRQNLLLISALRKINNQCLDWPRKCIWMTGSRRSISWKIKGPTWHGCIVITSYSLYRMGIRMQFLLVEKNIYWWNASNWTGQIGINLMRSPKKS